jgi:hypothetical protein
MSLALGERFVDRINIGCDVLVRLHETPGPFLLHLLEFVFDQLLVVLFLVDRFIYYFFIYLCFVPVIFLSPFPNLLLFV